VQQDGGPQNFHIRRYKSFYLETPKKAAAILTISIAAAWSSFCRVYVELVGPSTIQ